MNNQFLNSERADSLGIGFFKYLLGEQEKFIHINKAFFQILGYTSKEELGDKKLENLFVNPTDKSLFLKILKNNTLIKSFETLLKKRNQENVWVRISACIVAIEDGKQYIEAVISDIDYQKSLEQKLIMERNFFESLLDNIPDAVYFKDKENRILKVNKFYIKGTGLREQDIVGKTDFDFFTPEQAKGMYEDDKKILDTGKPVIGKIEKTVLPNGNWNQVITTKIPMRNANGEIIGTMGITRDMTDYANLEQQRLIMMVNALEVLGKALELRDPYTFSHTRHVAGIAGEMARILGWDQNRLLGIKLAAELHDLGKISIPLDILNKPGKLNKSEYRLIQEHVQNCYNLIKGIEFPFPLADMIYQHHERLDGLGYPRKLRGGEILLEARILAVSDVLEAMTHRRPYREALGLKKACMELKEGKGKKYDPKMVDLILDIIHQNGAKEFWLSE